MKTKTKVIITGGAIFVIIAAYVALSANIIDNTGIQTDGDVVVAGHMSGASASFSGQINVTGNLSVKKNLNVTNITLGTPLVGFKLNDLGMAHSAYGWPYTSSPFYFYDKYTGAGPFYMFYIKAEYDAAPYLANDIMGAMVIGVTKTTRGSVLRLTGLYSEADNYAPDTTDNVYGLQTRARNRGNGNVTDMIALKTVEPTNDGTGTIDNFYSVYISDSEDVGIQNKALFIEASGINNSIGFGGDSHDSKADIFLSEGLVLIFNSTSGVMINTTLNVTDLNTGGNAGSDLCVDAVNRLCVCGSCA